ncbi:PREDICTED: very-long-chain 3-oxoacyl-CoA reductase-like [Nanorana parkeri]|uniref:very-long-chain 3-oxoacyl-CoA reductase-like n=1 Tax=Nanorana parkeri TaxID=125878 RepID=UPI0008549B3F|nr:PREDICTED: very-long-chain 3-oxoacyl-CoA reductase-like [Nanorana parkeri]
MSDSVFYQGLTLLGFLALGHLVLKHTFKLLKGFRVHILSRWWRVNLKKYGGWAVVTGATDGIGKCYAKELAKRGFNVVLISRTLEKLQKVAAEIEQQSGRKTRIIQADFTGGAEIYPKIEEGLKDLDIGILVNNVGMSKAAPTGFLSSGDLNKSITDMMNCNVLSMLHMIRILLPRMVERKKGLIINISSEAGTHPYPRITLYSATKVFMDYFSRSLNIDYQSKGVTVQSVMPLMVSTNMTLNTKPNLLVKTADDYAREALNTAGLTSRTSGCLSHTIQSFVLDLFLAECVMSSKILAWIARRTLRLLLRIRKVD